SSSVAFSTRAIREIYRPGETPKASLRANGELGGRAVIVDAPADLACEHHRSLGLAHAVTGQAARGRDERLRSEPRRVAAAARELAPRVEQRLPQRRDVLPDRALRRDRAPDHPAAAVEVARQR